VTDQPYTPAPAYGTQAPQYASYPGAPAPAPQDNSTNGFAIASLITGIIGMHLFGIVFGFIGLSQIKKRGQRGRGLAITGIVFGFVWIVIQILLFVLIFAAVDEVKKQAAPNYSGDVSVTRLDVGDCINNLQESNNVKDVPKVPCATKHEGEVFALFNLPAGAWPGTDAVAKQAEDGCTKRFKSYSKTADESIQLFYLHPLEESWSLDRGVTCVATKDGGLTGSLKK
jgi:hypothetical protein